MGRGKNSTKQKSATRQNAAVKVHVFIGLRVEMSLFMTRDTEICMLRTADLLQTGRGSAYTPKYEYDLL